MAKEIIIPAFVQDYIDKVDGNGFSDFVKVSSDYQTEREEYPGKFATQSAFQNDFNRRTGQNRQLNYDDGLNAIDTRYKQRAFELAKQHGYKGPDPNQLSDKQFTKQGEKFQDMIDQARQRQQEKKVQPEQKQDTKPEQPIAMDKETESLEKLKDQQSQAKIKFNGAEKGEPAATEQPDRDQQRAAFLDKIKQTREQQAQRQQTNQPEI